MAIEFSIDHSAPDHLNARIKRLENYCEIHVRALNTYANKIAELEDKMDAIEDNVYDG